MVFVFRLDVPGSFKRCSALRCYPPNPRHMWAPLILSGNDYLSGNLQCIYLSGLTYSYTHTWRDAKQVFVQCVSITNVVGT